MVLIVPTKNTFRLARQRFTLLGEIGAPRQDNRFLEPGKPGFGNSERREEKGRGIRVGSEDPSGQVMGEGDRVDLNWSASLSDGNDEIQDSGRVAKNGKWLSRKDFGDELVDRRVARGEFASAHSLAPPLPESCAEVASGCQQVV